jgi:hypothetical protein
MKGSNMSPTPCRCLRNVRRKPPHPESKLAHALDAGNPPGAQFCSNCGVGGVMAAVARNIPGARRPE